MPNAEIVAIGSELLLGQIVDTNSAWMAERLTALGVNLFYKTVVGDNPGRMKEVITRALERSDVVITSGGLGPTKDDLTREIVAEIAGRRLVLEPRLLEQLEQRFRRRGLIMTPNNERQAYIPEGAIPVENPNGTAPSFIVEDPRGVIFVLPGVPFELKWLFEHETEPYLRKKFSLAEIITYRVLQVAGLGESSVDDRIGHLIEKLSNPTVGVLAHPGQVDVRIAAKAANREEAMKLIAPVEAEVRELLGRHIFAIDGETIEDVVGKLLRVQNKTVAVFEDLTGGLLTDRLQQASPEHFVEGHIGKSPTSMSRLLAFSRQPEQRLEDPAAMTAELAWAVRSQAGSDFGLALHAIPDPEDRTVNLARGETFIAVTDGNGFRNHKYNIAGKSQQDRARMTLNAIELLRMALTEGMA
jgi:nicotinamide-nucleotide amidase